MASEPILTTVLPAQVTFRWIVASAINIPFIAPPAPYMRQRRIALVKIAWCRFMLWHWSYARAVVAGVLTWIYDAGVLSAHSILLFLSTRRRRIGW